MREGILSQAAVEKKLVAAACLIGYGRAVEILQDKRSRMSVLESDRAARPSKKKTSAGGAVHARASGRAVRSLCGAAKGPDARYATGTEEVTCGRCRKLPVHG